MLSNTTAQFENSLGNSKLSGIIDNVGEHPFSNHLMAYLYNLCGAEHCAIFNLSNEQLRSITAVSLDGNDIALRRSTNYIKRGLWLSDPSMRAARNSEYSNGKLIRLDIPKLRNSALLTVYTQVSDRLLLCKKYQSHLVLLSILRSDKQGCFSAQDLCNIEQDADILLSAISKHISLVAKNVNLLDTLQSVDIIEHAIACGSQPFSPREREVSARIIYGKSAADISAELGIGEQTVTTYRKRIYQRLDIGSRQELLLWYLGMWYASALIEPGHQALILSPHSQ